MLLNSSFLLLQFSKLSWNSIAQKTNEILEKILPYEARAEFSQILRSFFGQLSFKKKCFWDLLTFNMPLIQKFIRISDYMILGSFLVQLIFWKMKKIKTTFAWISIWSGSIWFFNLMRPTTRYWIEVQGVS